MMSPVTQVADIVDLLLPLGALVICVEAFLMLSVMVGKAVLMCRISF